MTGRRWGGSGGRRQAEDVDRHLGPGADRHELLGADRDGGRRPEAADHDHDGHDESLRSRGPWCAAATRGLAAELGEAADEGQADPGGDDDRDHRRDDRSGRPDGDPQHRRDRRFGATGGRSEDEDRRDRDGGVQQGHDHQGGGGHPREGSSWVAQDGAEVGDGLPAGEHPGEDEARCGDGGIAGAFVLAAAGLLDGHRATTHWMYADALAKRFPAVRVDPDVLCVVEGLVATSAGTAAGLDLCLELVRHDHGTAVAAEVARRLIIPPHRQGGQAQYVSTLLPDEPGSALAPLLDWARSRLDRGLTLGLLAREPVSRPAP